ncbi:MAG: hypothetical protein WAM28_08600 [Chlamydiales bacterium]
MVNWKGWAQTVIWIHLCSLLGNAAVYSFVTFAKGVPFNTIFLYPETAPYYLTIYGLVLIFTLSLCGVGLIFPALFGFNDFRALIVSRGMLMIGTLSSLLPLTLITSWDMVLTRPQEMLFWVVLASGAQHFGIWLTFVLVIAFSLLMLLLFFLGSELSRRWAMLCLALAMIGALIALSCFWISENVLFFRLIYFIGSVGYLVWGFWLSALIKRTAQ